MLRAADLTAMRRSPSLGFGVGQNWTSKGWPLARETTARWVAIVAYFRGSQVRLGWVRVFKPKGLHAWMQHRFVFLRRILKAVPLFILEVSYQALRHDLVWFTSIDCGCSPCLKAILSLVGRECWLAQRIARESNRSSISYNHSWDAYRISDSTAVSAIPACE
jgi:hypothetical protein